jgi:hypothetical protein
MCIGFRLFHNGGLNEKIVFSKKGKDAVTNRLFVFARMEVLTDGRPFPYKLAPKFKQTCAQIRARRTRDGANDVVSARAGIAAEIKTASFVGEYKKTHGARFQNAATGSTGRRRAMRYLAILVYLYTMPINHPVSGNRVITEIKETRSWEGCEPWLKKRTAFYDRRYKHRYDGHAQANAWTRRVSGATTRISGQNSMWQTLIVAVA